MFQKYEFIYLFAVDLIIYVNKIERKLDQYLGKNYII